MRSSEWGVGAALHFYSPLSTPYSYSHPARRTATFLALTRAADAVSIGGMADQKQNQSQKQNNPAGNARNIGNDDDVRHAPESGEPTETGRVGQQGARGDKAGDRDESGRQGSGR